MSPVIRRVLQKEPPESAQQPSPRLFNVQQAATYSGTSVWQVRQWLHAGDLKAARVGKKDLIDRTALDSFLDGLFRIGRTA
jgi:excisionase family DNA binding protein